MCVRVCVEIEVQQTEIMIIKHTNTSKSEENINKQQ